MCDGLGGRHTSPGPAVLRLGRCGAVAGHADGETNQYRWFRISPRRIQARREVNELADRELMRDGRWATDTADAFPHNASGLRAPQHIWRCHDFHQ
jgi:hypothetical protein